MLLAWNLSILAAEEVEESEGIDLLLPEFSEVVAGVLAFSIIGFFVWKWVFPQIIKTLEARQQAIKDELESAGASSLRRASSFSGASGSHRLRPRSPVTSSCGVSSSSHAHSSEVARSAGARQAA